MKISRRNFMGSAAASAGGLCLFGRSGFNAGVLCADQPFAGESRDSHCAILDPEAECVLRESLIGYQAALGSPPICFSGATVRQLRSCRTVVIPSLGMRNSGTALLLLDLLEAGAQVLLESGAGFLSAKEFAAHQGMLERFFEIEVESAVDVWQVTEAIPYVHYEWPHETMVRDFSRAIPVYGNRGEVIGRVGELPVALKKRVANGELIFLGSPLGPALRAGDLEAQAWLHSLAVACSDFQAI